MANINLLPVEIRKDLPIDWPKLLPKLILLGLIIILIIFSLFFAIFVYSLKLNISKFDTELIHLQPQVAHALELKNEISQLQEQVATLESLEQKQSTWNELLWDINERIPLDLWLINFSADSDQTLTIVGQSLSFNSIGLFINQLNQSSYLSEVQLLGIETVSIAEHTVYNFELQARLSEGRGK